MLNINTAGIARTFLTAFALTFMVGSTGCDTPEEAEFGQGDSDVEFRDYPAESEGGLETDGESLGGDPEVDGSFSDRPTEPSKFTCWSKVKEEKGTTEFWRCCADESSTVCSLKAACTTTADGNTSCKNF